MRACQNDFSEALSLFIDRAADYATALSEVISSHEATEGEGRLAGILGCPAPR